MKTDIKPSTVNDFKPSERQNAIFQWIEDHQESGGNLVIQAGAGCGKSSTEFQAMLRCPKDKDIIYLAFNKHIEVDFKNRLNGKGYDNITVQTFHAYGLSNLRGVYKRVQVNADRVQDLLKNIISYNQKHLIPIIQRFISLCKAYMFEPTHESIGLLADQFGIELNGDLDDIVYAVGYIMGISQDNGVIDFDDMIYLPVHKGIKVKQFDIVFIDECQDLNPSQIELAFKAVKPGGMIIAVGDKFQSIYAWRGADSNALDNIINRLNADILPLDITYRCPQIVVDLVNTKFPNIPFVCGNDKIGAISNLTPLQFEKTVQDGDMILCRTNAPMVNYCYSLIRMGKKAVMRGRDIGKSLNQLIYKMKITTDDINDLIVKLSDYKTNECYKLENAGKMSQSQSLEDKVETILALSDNTVSIRELLTKINTIFSDDIGGIMFSSIHKAKGLESQNIYILKPELLPHPKALKSGKDWMIQQEYNCEYVAITRSLDNLFYINERI